jgi:hypothetical protein
LHQSRFERVLGPVAIVGDDHGNRLTGIPNAIDR